MIQFNTITEALHRAMELDVALRNVPTYRSEYINDDPSNAVNGWIGIYNGDMDFDPRTLGGTGARTWKASFDIKIVVQQVSYRSGQDAEEQLGLLLEKVLDLLNTNRSIRNTISMIDSLKVSYSYNMEVEETTYFQQAIITLAGQTETP